MNLGDYIKARRLALNMTRDELADKIGRQAETVEHYELGAKIPKYRDILAIMEVLESEVVFVPKERVKNGNNGIDSKAV